MSQSNPLFSPVSSPCRRNFPILIRVFVFISSLPLFGSFFNTGPPIAISIPIFTFVFTLSYSPCPRFPFAFCMHCTLLAMHCLPPLTPCLPLVSLSWFQPSSLSFILLHSFSFLAPPSRRMSPALAWTLAPSVTCGKSSPRKWKENVLWSSPLTG